MEAYDYIARDYPMTPDKYRDLYCSYCGTMEFSEGLDDFLHHEDCLWQRIHNAEALRKTNEQPAT